MLKHSSARVTLDWFEKSPGAPVELRAENLPLSPLSKFSFHADGSRRVCEPRHPHMVTKSRDPSNALMTVHRPARCSQIARREPRIR